MSRWDLIKYFTPQEFDDHTSPGTGALMNIAFVLKLDKLRDACKMPLIISSGYRTAKHNADVGGVPDSAHTTGHAADIVCVNSSARYTIVETALHLGFRRVGIKDDAVHIDDDITKAQDVLWLYPQKEKS